MPLVTITGLKKGYFEDTGNAAITVDGVHTYNGKYMEINGRPCIADLANNPVAHATLEFEKRWPSFLASGSIIFWDAEDREITRVHHAGWFGRKRTTIINGETFALPRRCKQYDLPGALIVLEPRKRVAKADIRDPKETLMYTTLAFHLWLVEDTSS